MLDKARPTRSVLVLKSQSKAPVASSSQNVVAQYWLVTGTYLNKQECFSKSNYYESVFTINLTS